MKKTIIIALALCGFFLFASCEKEITLVESNVVLTQYDSLNISSNPVGAHVYLDGKNSGYKTPCKIKWLEIRDIQVTLKYSPFMDKEMLIKSDSINKSYFYDFLADDRNFGGIDCLTDPEGADIYMDGQKLNAKTPLTINKLRPGDYKIRYEFRNFRADSSSVSVTSKNNDANYRNTLCKSELKDTSVFVDYTKETGIWNCTKVYIDNNKNPWFSAPGRGIYRLQENMFKQIYPGLRWNVINTVYQDSKGNTWFATPGLTKVTPDGEIKDAGYYFRSNIVNSICEDKNENIWVATTNGLMVCNLNSQMGRLDWGEFTANDHGLLSDNINNIIALNDGSVWASVLGLGVMKYQNGRWTTYTYRNSAIPDQSIVYMSSPNGEDIYFSSYLRVFSFSKGIWKTISNVSLYVNIGFFIDFAKNILSPLGGSIAILKNNGVLEYISTAVKGYQGYFDAKSIGVDGNKNVWIASSNHGIVRFKYYNK